MFNHPSQLKKSPTHLNTSIKLTVFTSKTPLNKTFSLVKGVISKTSNAVMTNGKAKQVTVSKGFTGLNALLNKLDPNQAISTGLFDVESNIVVTKDNFENLAEDKKEGCRARTREHMKQPDTGLVLFDYDHNDNCSFPAFKDTDELLYNLAKLSDSFYDAGCLIRPSSSNGIKIVGNDITQKSTSQHCFFLYDGDLEQLKNKLEVLSWLNGFGWWDISKSGSLLPRAIIDLAVFSPERLIFEASPTLKIGIEQIESQPYIKNNGTVLTLPDITQEQHDKALQRKNEARELIQPKADIVKAEYINEKANILVTQKGISYDEAAEAVTNSLDGNLDLNFPLTLPDGKSGVVADLIEKPEFFDCKAMPDPFEGKEYGKTTAKFYYNDGNPIIHSQAHGGITYYIEVDHSDEFKKCNDSLPLSKYDFPHRDEKISTSGDITIKLKATTDNYAHMLAQYGFTCRYNQTNKEVEIVTSNNYSMANSSESTLADVYSKCALNHLPDKNLLGALVSIADANSYNPIIDWVLSKPWDGKDRFHPMLGCFRSDQDPMIKELFFKKWMFGALGIQANTGSISLRGVLTLTGIQNIGKTTAMRHLTGDVSCYFKDGLLLDPSNKDSVLKCASHWIVEIGELDATFRKADIAALKAFISESRDVLRKSYAKTHSTMPRTTTLYATVNDPDFLVDTSGNSRFWTVQVNDIDLVTLSQIDMQQLWAQIMDELTTVQADGTLMPWFMDKEQEKIVNAVNVKHAKVCPIEESVLDYFDKPTTGNMIKVSPTQFCDILGLNKQSAKNTSIVGKVLKGKGYKKIRRQYIIPEAIYNDLEYLSDDLELDVRLIKD